MPRLLTVDQKQCVDNSERCLQLFHNATKMSFYINMWQWMKHGSTITLRKEEPAIANIIYHYWCIWRKKRQKNVHKWRGKKCSNTKIMHCVTSQSQWWQNYMNCTLNCFHNHPILEIWPLQLLAVCRPQKNAPGKENWLQWRSDKEN